MALHELTAVSGATLAFAAVAQVAQLLAAMRTAMIAVPLDIDRHFAMNCSRERKQKQH